MIHNVLELSLHVGIIICGLDFQAHFCMNILRRSVDCSATIHHTICSFSILILLHKTCTLGIDSSLLHFCIVAPSIVEHIEVITMLMKIKVIYAISLTVSTV